MAQLRIGWRGECHGILHGRIIASLVFMHAIKREREKVCSESAGGKEGGEREKNPPALFVSLGAGTLQKIIKIGLSHWADKICNRGSSMRCVLYVVREKGF